jgi:hypothetical protein
MSKEIPSPKTVRPVDPSCQMIPETFEVIIRCRDEQHQRTLYHLLTAEGLKCRLSIL